MGAGAAGCFLVFVSLTLLLAAAALLHRQAQPGLVGRSFQGIAADGSRLSVGGCATPSRAFCFRVCQAPILREKVRGTYARQLQNSGPA